jgi:hypothetical protein
VQIEPRPSSPLKLYDCRDTRIVQSDLSARAWEVQLGVTLEIEHRRIRADERAARVIDTQLAEIVVAQWDDPALVLAVARSSPRS